MWFWYIQRHSSAGCVDALWYVQRYWQSRCSVKGHRWTGAVEGCRRCRLRVHSRLCVRCQGRCVEYIYIFVSDISRIMKILLRFIDPKEPFSCHRWKIYCFDYFYNIKLKNSTKCKLVTVLTINEPPINEIRINVRFFDHVLYKNTHLLQVGSRIYF